MRLQHYFLAIACILLGDQLAWSQQLASTTPPTIVPQEYSAMSDSIYAHAVNPTHAIGCTENCVEPVCAPWYENLSLFAGLDGSKQPQDFGVNANLGGQVHANLGLPVWQEYGLGVQLGTTYIATGNAVQVYELIGQSTGRTQSYTTVGLFQRTDSGWAWGAVYDFLYEDSYDHFNLGQWRTRLSYDLSPVNQIGITANFAAQDDVGTFANTPVRLKPITQGNLFWRRFWESGTQTTFWVGLAEEHGENNAALGPSDQQSNPFLFGADFLAPLNDHWALYGEANLIMPADTGTVDAFLGIVWTPGVKSRNARRTAFSPLLPVAAPTSFSVDLE